MEQNQIRILLVEDEFITREALAAVLEEMNYIISGDAMNAKEAMAILEQGKTDLAILDINIKGEKDGIWLAGQIREKFKIPFIFLTGFGDQPTVQRAINTGPYGYLIKPFNKIEIFAAIEVALKNYSKEVGSNPEPDADHLMTTDHKSEAGQQPEADQLLIASPETEVGSNTEERKDQPSDHDQAEEASDLIMAKDYIFVRDQYMYVKLKITDILYLKSFKNYIEAFLPNKKHLIRGKLKDFTDRLPKDKFIQVHRSYVINIEAVDGFGAGFLKINNIEIPLGASYRDELKRRLKLF